MASNMLSDADELCLADLPPLGRLLRRVQGLDEVARENTELADDAEQKL